MAIPRGRTFQGETGHRKHCPAPAPRCRDVHRCRTRRRLHAGRSSCARSRRRRSGNPAEQSDAIRRTSSSFQPICGTRASAGKRLTVPGNRPRPLSPGFFAGFEQRLQPEADAEKRHARGDPSSSGVRSPRSSSARIIWPKWPTPGRIIFDARSQALRRRARRSNSQPISSERVLDGSQIARSVIEDGDHRSPLVDGN